jgi:hypothetical protein
MEEAGTPLNKRQKQFFDEIIRLAQAAGRGRIQTLTVEVEEESEWLYPAVMEQGELVNPLISAELVGIVVVDDQPFQRVTHVASSGGLDFSAYGTLQPGSLVTFSFYPAPEDE